MQISKFTFLFVFLHKSLWREFFLPFQQQGIVSSSAHAAAVFTVPDSLFSHIQERMGRGKCGTYCGYRQSCSLNLVSSSLSQVKCYSLKPKPSRGASTAVQAQRNPMLRKSQQPVTRTELVGLDKFAKSERRCCVHRWAGICLPACLPSLLLSLLLFTDSQFDLLKETNKGSLPSAHSL